MKITPEAWKQVDPLVTQALAMGGEDRAAWLADLRGRSPGLAPIVEMLLSTHDRLESQGAVEPVVRLAAPPKSEFAAGEPLGPFRLVRALGRGGMGEVWLAEQADGRVERRVALKLPTLLEAGGERAARFRRERDILAKLEHPHIARLYDAGVTETGQPWLAMEYVEGEPLDRHCDARELGLRDRLALMRQVLAAVAHAHRHLVVHRDLKPSNILIDAAGQVKLLDFGIAKLLGGETTGEGVAQDLTRVGGRVMTLRYAAPEQASAGAITTATDVYALGVVMHELLAGVSPYREVREKRPFHEAALLGAEIARPSGLAIPADVARRRGGLAPGALSRELAGDLDAIVLKALRRDPVARYPTVVDFDEDILATLERRPVKARAGTWRYLAGRFARRHRVPMAMGVAVVLALAVGLVVAERERQDALAQKERAERHFASVRELAKTFIFDVHREIEPLEGSLKARRILVETSLRYLDTLAAEDSRDPALLREVAAAYRTIGTLQGQPGRANLGDLKSAIASYEKAHAVHGRLEAAGIADRASLQERADLEYALARARVAAADPRWKDAMQAAVSMAERMAALSDATFRDRARVAVMRLEAAHLGAIVDGPTATTQAAAIAALERLAVIARDNPGEEALQQRLPALYQRVPDTVAGGSSTPEGRRIIIDHYRRGLALAQERVARNPSDAGAKTVANATALRLAKALAQDGTIAEAEELAARSLATNTALAAREPDNAQARVDSLAAQVVLAQIAHLAGRPAEAVERGRRSLATVRGMPPSFRESLLGRNEEAESKAYLAYGLVRLAETGPPAQRDARLREARPLLRDAKAFVQEVESAGVGKIPDEDKRELEDFIARAGS